ncbi:hypothetical protein [Hymenobacter amundsenii]|uniref:hypothetical protein n=1 Tax=Hymenobacter amundsenii TaxID=2006685 RepID=UPI0013FD5BFA
MALNPVIETATPVGRLVLGIFAALAEYDRESMPVRPPARAVRIGHSGQIVGVQQCGLGVAGVPGAMLV